MKTVIINHSAVKLAQSAPAPAVTRDEVLLGEVFADTWEITVHNDDINSFDNVITAFVNVLGMLTEAAAAKAFDIHNNLKSVVWVGGREECENKAAQLRNNYKLDATTNQL